MRVMLFTDTLADVNGVSRFIQDMASAAASAGQEFRVVTSSRLAIPARENLANVKPAWARAMPKYPQLELAWPSVAGLRRELEEFRPDVVHVSTPGPVGLCGMWLARRAGLAIVGTYHTDFPAFIEKLFDDEAMTWCCRRTMAAVYTRMAMVLTRSAEYGPRVEGLGVAPSRVRVLRAGTDVEKFSPRFRDERVWVRLGVPADAVKVLCVGRVSVEKNLPFLVRVWKRVVRGEMGEQRAGEQVDGVENPPHAPPSGRGFGENPPPAPPSGRGGRAALVVVGDGPYRAEMERELSGCGVVFLGFRGGEELSTIYASSDLCVFPSITDTLGQVALEAQASGVPVLVSDVGGPRQVIVDGGTGFVLPATDVGAWAGKISALAGDQVARKQMGAAGVEHAGKMGIGRSFEDFWDVHERVVAEKKKELR